MSNRIQDDLTVSEHEPLQSAATYGELAVYRYEGFGNERMDTQRDKSRLEQLWESGEAAWKIWED